MRKDFSEWNAVVFDLQAAHDTSSVNLDGTTCFSVVPTPRIASPGPAQAQREPGVTVITISSLVPCLINVQCTSATNKVIVSARAAIWRQKGRVMLRTIKLKQQLHGSLSLSLSVCLSLPLLSLLSLYLSLTLSLFLSTSLSYSLSPSPPLSLSHSLSANASVSALFTFTGRVVVASISESGIAAPSLSEQRNCLEQRQQREPAFNPTPVYRPRA